MEREDIRRVSEELEEMLKITQKGQETRINLPGLDTQEETEEETMKELQQQAAAEETAAERTQTGTEEIQPVKPKEVQPVKSEEVQPVKIKEPPRKRRKPDKYAAATLLRPSDGLVAAFLVPVVVMIVIFAQRRIFPFGDESFLRTDMYHQYAPFFAEFQHKLKTGEGLLYSWNIGMGVNFTALYAYYLASPFNWLLILCPKELVIEFMTYLIVIKIGLSGLTFAWYLRKHEATSDFGVAFFGIFYALSGYMAAYSWNIMWLDCILLFPLIVLGLERLVREKRGAFYCICLGLSILSNYYISIMTCLFLVLYFIALLILEGKRKFRDWVINFLQFGVYSLLAGGLAAVVLIPEIFMLQMTASGDVNFPQTFTSYFSIFDMLARHIANVKVEIGLDHWPNIYCGVAVFMFFLMYLSCEKIKAREKVVYSGLLLIFFASFSVNALNFIWHGFHYPNSLPCRQSFIYIFLLLVMCHQAYIHLREISWKRIIMSFWVSAAFVILAEKLVTEDHFHFAVFYGAILFMAAYAGILYLYKKKKAGLNGVVLMALAVVSVEAAVNTTITSVTTTSRSAYIKDNKAVEQLLEQMDGDTFYRVEKVTRKTKNDGAWMNFPSVSLFSSTANAALTDFFKEVGCEGNTNAYSITGSTPLVDMLFSVKYGLYSEAHPNDPYLELIDQQEDTYLYRRAYTLPVGFLVPDNFEQNWQRDFGNPAVVQNDLCDVVGADKVLKEQDVEITESSARFTPKETGEYYAYVSNRSIEKVTMSKGEDSETFNNVKRGYLLELGTCYQDEEVHLNAGDKEETLSVEIYLFDYESLAQVYEKMNQRPLTVTSWREDSLEGTIETDKAGRLFTTIPYEKGWSAYVDGEKKETVTSADTFVSVDIPEGTHTVRFEYVPQGLKGGAVITAGSGFLLAALALAGFMMRKKKAEKETELDIMSLDDETEE